MESGKQSMSMKGSYRKLIFYNMPVNVLCSIFYHFFYHNYILFLNQFQISLMFYCNSFNPVSKNQEYLQKFVFG